MGVMSRGSKCARYGGFWGWGISSQKSPAGLLAMRGGFNDFGIENIVVLKERLPGARPVSYLSIKNPDGVYYGRMVSSVLGVFASCSRSFQRSSRALHGKFTAVKEGTLASASVKSASDYSRC